MRLVLVRHGEAEARAVTDAARALTAQGRQQARATGHWLAGELAGPLQLLVSPFRRAQETAAEIAACLPQSVTLTVPRITPDDDPRQALEAIAAVAAQEQVVVVTHMPLVAGLHQWLCESVIVGGRPFGLAEARCYALEALAPGLAVPAAGFVPALA